MGGLDAVGVWYVVAGVVGAVVVLLALVVVVVV
jgi:hypothetical protein